jgi:hypothetical protein
MSTLADELLQDFEDSGSEGGEEQNDGLFPENEESKNGLNGHADALSGATGRMELDGDEEEVDEDQEMAGLNDSGLDVEDEEETKAKVEKMELGGVDDVRSVARLMKTLEPVLEVSNSLFPYCSLLEDLRFTSALWCISPDISATTENRTFSSITTIAADDLRWLYRRQPRIPPPNTVKYPINIYRYRNHDCSQVHPRSLLNQIS